MLAGVESLDCRLHWIYIDVFRTLLSIYDGAFLPKWLTAYI